VTYLDSIPLSIGGTSFGFRAEGLKDASSVSGDVYNVGTRFFETMGIPLNRGRDFSRRTDAGDTLIVNQTMARKLFGNEEAIGRGVMAEKKRYTVVGVARDSKSRTPGEEPAASAYFFLESKPEDVMSFYGISIAVKTSINPRALARPLRREIASLDPNLAVFNTKTFEEHVNDALLLPRLCATLLAVFGAAGLTLATVGLYGVMSYAVRRRTREIGIRMALGAGTAGVLRLVLRQGLTLAVAGLAAGLAIALVVTRFLAALLYGIAPTDVMTFAGVGGALLAVAAAAAYLPARRAARIQPMSALRHE
jgi:predicted permease